jgi:hypothetical protein
MIAAMSTFGLFVFSFATLVLAFTTYALLIRKQSIARRWPTVRGKGEVVFGGECAGRSYIARFHSLGDPDNSCVSRDHCGVKEYRECSLDIDGNGEILATADSLIHARIALDAIDEVVIGRIDFPISATRKHWFEIRRYLVTRCEMSNP